MALVSYTQSAAGEPMQFTMNKNDLLSVPKVMADPFFSLEANWFRVSFVFKHTTSGKRFVPSFRTFSATKYLRIRSGMSGGDGFELKKIIISKSDRTFLVIKTTEIPSVANYTFSLMSSGGGSGGSNNAGSFYTKNFSNPLELFELLGQTSRPEYIDQQPNVTNGTLNFKSNYWAYGTAFVVDLDMGNKVIEANSTYKIKLTGTANQYAQMWFKFGRNEDPNYGWRNVIMKDAQGNPFTSTAFTNGVLEFYATTDSEILTVDQFQKFLIFLDWSYQESVVSISSIEITKV